MKPMPYGPRPYLVRGVWWVPDVWLERHREIEGKIKRRYSRRNISRLGYEISREYLTKNEEALLLAGAEERDG